MMADIEVHNTIKKIINLYHLFGIWKHEEKTSYHERGRKLFPLILSVSFVISLISGALQCEDFYESVYLFALAIGVAVVTVKLIIILWKKDEIFTLLRNLTDVHCVAQREKFTQVSKKFKFFMNFVSFFCVMLFTAFVAAVIIGLPIFSKEKHLCFSIGFPLDWKNNEIAYWIAYAYLMIVIALTVLYMLITGVIWYIMFSYSIKYQILEMQFKNIGAATTKRNISEAEKHNLFLQELIELIKTHRSIHAHIERLKRCFGKLFFTQINTSGICICGSIYVLTFSSHDNLILTIMYIVFTFYNFFDIFMLTFLGNEIKFFSGQLSYGLFQSDWINQSKSCKKCILILMEVLKQPQELLIGLVYPLNLETFTSILKLTYSSFNILLNLK